MVYIASCCPCPAILHSFPGLHNSKIAHFSNSPLLKASVQNGQQIQDWQEQEGRQGRPEDQDPPKGTASNTAIWFPCEYTNLVSENLDKRNILTIIDRDLVKPHSFSTFLKATMAFASPSLSTTLEREFENNHLTPQNTILT